jgi:septum formation protein
MRLVLASRSTSRSMLLRGAGVAFDIVTSGVDEAATKARMLDDGPKAVAEALAEEKALAVAVQTEGLVIGADQTLELAGALFDKAATMDEARERLQAFRGRTHQLHSAVAVAEGARVVWRETVSASLTMRDFSDAWLDGYLERGGETLLGSVGCYQLEGEGAQLFDRVEGDYFAILGLPLFGLVAYLRGRGVLGT